MAHLNSYHLRELKKAVKEDNGDLDSSPTESDNADNGDTTMVHSTSTNKTQNKNDKQIEVSQTKTPQEKQKQLSLRKIIKRNRATYTANNKRKKELDQRLMKMIISTNSSFNIVENKEFMEFIHALDERYPIPCRNTVAKPYLNELYKDVQTNVQNLLNSAKG